MPIDRNWKHCALGEVITLQRGFDLPERLRLPGSVPIVSSSGITGTHHVAKVKGPGVVTGRYGTLGDVFYLQEDFWPLNTTLYVRDFKGNDPRFISYLLKTLYLAHHNAAGAVPGVNRNALHLLAVRVPLLPIQHTIAAILSAYDDLIENNARRIALLEQMAQTLYQEWFVQFRFPGHEDVPLVETEQRMVPQGWEVTKLGSIASEVRRSVHPESVNPETPYFGLEHFPCKSIALTDWGTAKTVQSTKLAFKRGEILFGKIRPYLHKVGIAPVDGVCSSDTIVIRPNQEQYRALLLTCVSSDHFISFASKTAQGTHMPRANWDVLATFKIVVPPPKLLFLFNNVVETAVMSMTNFLFRNRNLRRTRNLLLPKLVEGEVDVSGWGGDKSDGINRVATEIVATKAVATEVGGRGRWVAETAATMQGETVEQDEVEWRSLWEQTLE